MSSKTDRKKLEHAEVLIIFVDKSNAEYRYIPIRKAELKKVRVQSDRAYFDVILKSYCVPQDLEEFNRVFRIKYKNYLWTPSADESVQETETIKGHDGFLAFEGDTAGVSLSCNEDSWKKIVLILSDLEAFKKHNCLFSKASIKEVDDNTPLQIKKNGKYKLKYNREYLVDIDFHFIHGNDNQARMKIVHGDSINCLDRTDYDIEVQTSDASYRIKTNEKTRNASVSFLVEHPSKEVLAAKMPLYYSVKLSWWKWPVIVALLLLAAITMDSISKNESGDIEWEFSLAKSVVKAISAFAIWLAGVLYSRKK